MVNECLNYRFADFVLDVHEHRLIGSGTNTYLTPKTFETLLLLIRRHGRLVTKRELLDAVWPDTAVTENALTRCIKEVRAALGDDVLAPRFVETIPRVGYKFVADVEPVDVQSAGPGASGFDVRPEARRQAFESDCKVLVSEPVPAWQRRALAVVTLVAFIALVPSGSYFDRPSSAIRTFHARDFILVTDFDNQTREALLDRSLATAFVVGLEQSSYANVIPRARVVDALERMGKAPDQAIDETLGREICLREHVRGLVSVSITKLGREYSLSARLVDPQSGNVLRSRVEYIRDMDHILSALGTLAAVVRRDLGESLAAIQISDRDLLEVTTPSLRALKAYSDGVALWEKGEYDAAVNLYEAAVQQDPGFAMAHAALGTAYYSHIYTDRIKGKEHFDKATQLAERTTERERLSIRMQYEANLGHVETASASYKAYLQSYPDDFRARYDFGTMLRDGGRFAEAISQFQAVLRIAPTYAPAEMNLATCYKQRGQYSDALIHYARAFDLQPSWITRGNLNHEYGFTLIQAGDPDKAREVFNRALSTGTKAQALRSLALLDMYQGKYHDAASRLEEAIVLNASSHNGLAEARNHLFLSIVFDGQQRPSACFRELRRAAQRIPAVGSPLWLDVRIGVGYARLGAVAAAGELLTRAREDTDRKSAEQLSDLHRFEGEMELARHNIPHALELLRLADDERRSAFTVESLARAYRFAGQTDDAMHFYEELLRLKDESLGFEPQQNWIAAHYWLARGHLSRRDAQSARQALGALLDLWHDADLDLALRQKAVQLRKTTSWQ